VCQTESLKQLLSKTVCMVWAKGPGEKIRTSWKLIVVVMLTENNPYFIRYFSLYGMVIN
jgi:hypothetical protein